jgi:hypothetical protein
MEVKGHKLDKFTQGYLECALWASVGDSRDPQGVKDSHSFSDLSEEALKAAIADCASFQEANAADLELAESFRPLDYLGHDFWLTRNHHGAGFWDRGMGDVGERLTDASHVYGGLDLYVGDDGEIYG